MPLLTVTTITATKVSIADPDGGSLLDVAGNSTVTVDISLEDLDQARSKTNPLTDSLGKLDKLVSDGLITYSIEAEESAGLVIGHQEISIDEAFLRLKAIAAGGANQLDFSTGGAVPAGVTPIPSARLPQGARVLASWWEVDVPWAGDDDGIHAFDGIIFKVGPSNAAAGTTLLDKGLTAAGFLGQVAGTVTPVEPPDHAKYAKKATAFAGGSALVPVPIEFQFRVNASDPQGGAFQGGYDMQKLTAGKQTLHVNYVVLGTGSDI